MPHVFFNHAANFFRLDVEAGFNYWDQRTLIALVQKCGYTLLNAINATVTKYASDKFCVDEDANTSGQSWITSYEKLTLSGSNHSGATEWQCISKAALATDCPMDRLDIEIWLILMGICALAASITACYCKFRNSQQTIRSQAMVRYGSIQTDAEKGYGTQGPNM